MNRINVLNAIEEYQNYHSSIFLSYGINLPFYESVILRRLWKTNSRNNLVFIDAHRYQDTIHYFRDAIGYIGKRYLVVPVNVGAYQTFHPKLILLLGVDRGRLIIGSGNLTFNGYGDNLEVFTLFDWARNQTQHGGVFSFIWNMINRIQEDWGYSEQTKRMLQKAEYQSQWLQNTNDDPNPPLLSSYTSSIFKGIKAVLDGKVVNKITIISPFIDGHAQGIRSLYSEFNPSQIDLILQANRTVVDVQNIQALISEGIPLNLFQAFEESRYIHAKIYLFETAEDILMFSGSANCTQSGLLSDIKTGNFELMTYREITNKEEADQFLRSGIRYKEIENLEDVSFQENNEYDEKFPSFIRLLDASIEVDRLTIEYYLNDLPNDVEEIVLRSDFPKEIKIPITDFLNGKNQHTISLTDTILPLISGVFSVYIQGKRSLNGVQHFSSNSLWVTNLTELNRKVLFLTPEDEETARLLREKLLNDDRKWESLYRTIIELVELDVGQITKVSKATTKTKSLGEKEEDKEKESILLVISEHTEKEDRLSEIENEIIRESRISSLLRIVFGMFPQEEKSAANHKTIQATKEKLHKPSKNIGKRFVSLVRRFIRVLDNTEFMQSKPTYYLLAYYSTFQRINWILYTSGVLNAQEYFEHSLAIFHGYFGIISEKSSPFVNPSVQNYLNRHYETQWQETQAHLHAIINLYILQNIFSNNKTEREQLDTCLIHLFSVLACIFPPEKLILELNDLDQLADFFNYEPVELFLKLNHTVNEIMSSVKNSINEWIVNSDSMSSKEFSFLDPDIIFSGEVSLRLGDIWVKKYLKNEEDIWGWSGLIHWCIEMDYDSCNGRYLQRLVNVLKNQDQTLNLDEVYFELAKKKIEEKRYKDALELIEEVLKITEKDADNPFIKSVLAYRKKAEFFNSVIIGN